MSDNPMIIQAPTITAEAATMPAEVPADAPPEVRQCQDPDNPMFGAVAVAGTEGAAGLYGVMHPNRGGHWCGPDDIAEWTVL